MDEPLNNTHKMSPVHVLFPEELLEEVDRYATDVAREFPGVNITRSGAVRRLVELALKGEKVVGERGDYL
jgi:metal-responsive CopG/Arc/MetJ family transcriptional regulator